MEIKAVKFYKKLPSKMRVAAYARVSSGKDSMLHSLSSQISYYNELIQKNKNWLFSGIYADEAISGTKDNRPEFQRMLQDAKEGKLDLIITKSISRFARNTVTLLKAVRELKQYGVNVYFEEQNLYSMSGEGEFMLSILASYAQEEAKSVSENMKWRARANFEKGQFYSITVYGYRLHKGVLKVVKKEAEIVKTIFDLYLKGYGCQKIVDYLGERNVVSRFGKRFTRCVVHGMLQNEVFTGKAVLQKTFISDYMTKKYVYNKGELTMWVVENAHEAIIDRETFDKVQIEMKRRDEAHPQKENRGPQMFSKMLVCGNCGRHYIRKRCRDVYSWRCVTYDHGSAKACISQSVPELELLRVSCEVLGLKEFDENIFRRRVKRVLVQENHLLTFELLDGRIIDKYWVPKRKEVRIYAPNNCNSTNNKQINQGSSI